MQMILRYRTGTYYSQPSICLNTLGASVNVGANVMQVATGLRAIGGISASGSYSSLSLSASQSKINSKIPFYVGLTWNGGGGHATVCSGYSGSSLQIIDPSGSAATTYFAYSTMVTNCNFKSGTGKWDHGVY